MKLSLKIAKALEQLINGEVLPASSAKSKLTERLIEENILYRVGKQRRTLHLRDEEALKVFLANQLQINNLQQYISAKEDEESTRAEFVRLTTESKDSKERAFKGFLVNSYFPIKAKLNGQEITINPPSGSFVLFQIMSVLKFQNPLLLSAWKMPEILVKYTSNAIYLKKSIPYLSLVTHKIKTKILSDGYNKYPILTCILEILI